MHNGVFDAIPGIEQHIIDGLLPSFSTQPLRCVALRVHLADEDRCFKLCLKESRGGRENDRIAHTLAGEQLQNVLFGEPFLRLEMESGELAYNPLAQLLELEWCFSLTLE